MFYRLLLFAIIKIWINSYNDPKMNPTLIKIIYNQSIFYFHYNLSHCKAGSQRLRPAAYPDRTVVYHQPDISKHAGSVLGTDRVSDGAGRRAAVDLGDEGASPQIALDQVRLLAVLRKPVSFVPKRYDINRPEIKTIKTKLGQQREFKVPLNQNDHINPRNTLPPGLCHPRNPQRSTYMVSDPTAGREQSGKETCKRCRHHKRPAGLGGLCAGVRAQPRRRLLRGSCRVLPPGERDADCGRPPRPPGSQGSGSGSEGGSGSGSSSGAAVPRCLQVKPRRTAEGRPPGHGHRILTSVRGSAARGQTEVTRLAEPTRRSQVSRGGRRRWGRAGSHPRSGRWPGHPAEQGTASGYQDTATARRLRGRDRHRATAAAGGESGVEILP